MNKSKFLSILVILLLVSNTVLLYFFIGKPSRQEGPKNIIIEKLHFNKKQIKSYELLIQKHRSDINQEENKIRKLKNALYHELNKSGTKKDTIISEIILHQKQIENIHYAHFEEIKAICKPKQLKYFKQLTYELGRLFDKKPHHPKQK